MHEAPLGQAVLAEAWSFLVDNVRNGVAVIGEDGRLVAANPVLARWLEAAAVIGTSWSDWAASLPGSEPMIEIRSASGVVRRVEVQSRVLCEGAACILILTDQSTSKAFESYLLNEIQKVVKLAGEDALTGVGNRRSFDDAVEHLLAENDRRFGVIVVDLDNFKAVNDSLGHEAGDQVLRATADAIRQFVREDDLVARIGGDEFAVLLPNVTVATLTEAGERLRKNLSRAKVSASLGYAHSGPDPATVVSRADKWMYQHKAEREGRGMAALAQEEEEASQS